MAAILTFLHFSCLLLSLPRTFAYAVLLPEELSLTCSDDSSFVSSSFKGGQLPGSSCVTPCSLSVFSHLLILSLFLPLEWKFEQPGDHVPRFRLTLDCSSGYEVLVCSVNVLRINGRRVCGGRGHCGNLPRKSQCQWRTGTQAFTILWSPPSQSTTGLSDSLCLGYIPLSEPQAEERRREAIAWVIVGKPGHFIESPAVPDVL